MLKKILLGFLAVIAVVLVYATTKPNSFQIERSTVVNAPTEKVFPYVNNLQLWRTWSPYEKMDPDMNVKMSGPESGVDASQEWDGKKMGAGSLTITKSEPYSLVSMNLDMLRPFKCSNVVDFILEPQGDNATKITWAMRGESPYLAKVMSLFIDVDKMTGQQFEEGLENLKKCLKP